jgi:hypothetical protein
MIPVKKLLNKRNRKKRNLSKVRNLRADVKKS